MQITVAAYKQKLHQNWQVMHGMQRAFYGSIGVVAAGPGAELSGTLAVAGSRGCR